MTREEKLKMLLHPEQYTDEQMDGMLNETEAGTPDVNEEWRRFEARVTRGDHKLYKIAAMFIGVLMLSGIAYAAVHIIGSNSQDTQKEQATAAAGSRQTTSDAQIAEADSTVIKPVVFEDAELSTILSEIAAFHQCETVYKQEASRHIRLYFTWDKKQTIDDIIDTFNKFERIHITRDNKKLTVE